MRHRPAQLQILSQLHLVDVAAKSNWSFGRTALPKDEKRSIPTKARRKCHNMADAEWDRGRLAIKEELEEGSGAWSRRSWRCKSWSSAHLLCGEPGTSGHVLPAWSESTARLSASSVFLSLRSLGSVLRSTSRHSASASQSSQLASLHVGPERCLQKASSGGYAHS